MVRFLVHWAIVALALAVAAYLLPGVRIHSFAALAVGSLAIGFANAVVRPILTWLTLPLTIVTLGLFLLVVNGLAFGFAAWLTPGFEVATLWQAVLGACVVSVVSWLADFGAERR